MSISTADTRTLLSFTTPNSPSSSNNRRLRTMTEPEKMEALKRAYAEMILNTAKEAAARVMVAELKARRLEHDLISTKEEAARMLRRLKQMIDAQMQEAKITSSNEHRKIDELESQLNEAEEIILDLRAELNQTQEQLDEAKNKKLPPIRQNENAEVCNVIPNDNYSGYELLTSSLASRSELITVDDKSTFSNVNFGHNNPTFDQIKEPELFKNGCRQRIFASETSLVHESLVIGDTSNSSNNSTNSENVNVVGSTSVLEEKVQHGKNEPSSVIRRSVRKRKLKFWDDIITACGLRRSHQFKKPRETSQHLSSFSTSKVKQCVKSGEGQFQAEDETQVEDNNRLDHVSFPEKKLVHSENLPENMELVDVLVKQDELAATSDLNSSSRIHCDVKGDTATKASNISDSKKPLNYTFSRKWKKNSMIYPEKNSSFVESLLQKENGNPGF
ncbi:hypothetical protein BUALT_Bualt04G0152200 [Buddleja alternifolia]|uniref:Uncharacterized protein n=1 Tax=Buddleja alternifolia TaxID=168488 RepID=A0AAV6XP42_9LAMI|nr:hypothetical protein BUALT_Bualt04G0152200 [Buddleja alternifolia]